MRTDRSKVPTDLRVKWPRSSRVISRVDYSLSQPGAKPAHGTVSMNSNGSFIYQPATSFTGTDSFTDRANDGLDSSGPVTVTITVQ